MSFGRRGLPLLAAAAVGVQVGAAIVATRFVIEQTDPASLAMLRYAIGFLCLLPPSSRRGASRSKEKTWCPSAC